MQELKESNKEIITQLCSFLQQFSDQVYSKKLSVLNNSSIGMHVRHILEFYDCFLNNVNNSSICYDSRQRQLVYEVSVSATLDTLQSIIQRILDLQHNTSVEIASNTSLSEGPSSYINSCVARELLYTLDHCIHHMALIKIGTQITFPNIAIPKTFGVAPSTVRFQEKKCAQ